MTVIDQRARVPSLGAAAISRLTEALDRPEVRAAFLFGSQARRSPGPLSDVDVAILHPAGLDPQARLRLRLRLAADAGAALATKEVDIVLLNDAPPLLRDRILRDAVVLIDRDPAATRAFREQAERDYRESEEERRELSRRLRRSIEEGTFGRRG